MRKGLGLKLEGETIDEKPMLVADVEVDGLNRQDWHIWPFVRAAQSGFVPYRTPRCFNFQRGRRRWEPMLRACSSSDWLSRRARCLAFDLSTSVRMVNRYRVGRVFLAGDAAHVHPPEEDRV